MKAPKFISTSIERRYWRQLLIDLKQKGVDISQLDGYALGLLACNLATIEECRADISERGTHIQMAGDRGHIVSKRNPSLELLKEAQQQVKFYLSQFHMTPSSRGKVLFTGVIVDDGDGWDQV
jgi:P27 family predicted phage terminase small subunit